MKRHAAGYHGPPCKGIPGIRRIRRDRNRCTGGVVAAARAAIHCNGVGSQCVCCGNLYRGCRHGEGGRRAGSGMKRHASRYHGPACKSIARVRRIRRDRNRSAWGIIAAARTVIYCNGVGDQFIRCGNLYRGCRHGEGGRHAESGMKHHAAGYNCPACKGIPRIRRIRRDRNRCAGGVIAAARAAIHCNGVGDQFIRCGNLYRACRHGEGGRHAGSGGQRHAAGYHGPPCKGVPRIGRICRDRNRCTGGIIAAARAAIHCNGVEDRRIRRRWTVRQCCLQGIVFAIHRNGQGYGEALCGW